MSDDDIHDGEFGDHEFGDHEFGDHEFGDREIDNRAINDLLHRRAARGDERGAEAVWSAAAAGGDEGEVRQLTGTSRLAVAAVVLVLAAIGVGIFSSLTSNDSGLVITQTPGDTSAPAPPAPSTPLPGSSKTPPTAEDGGEQAAPQNDEGAASSQLSPPADGAGESPGEGEKGTGEPIGATEGEATPDDDSRPDDGGLDAESPPTSTDIAEERSAEPTSDSDQEAITDWVDYGKLGTVDSARSEPNGAGWIDFITPGPEAGANGGTLRRTGTSQRFIDGRLVVEVDYAATVDGRGDSAWGEIVVSPSDAPTAAVDGAFYASQRFPGAVALGCRLQADRHVFCHLFAPDGERIWQMSWFASVGEQQVVNADPKTWRVCGPGAAATSCLNRFRIELTEETVLVAVNDEIVLHETNVAGIPSSLVDGDVYVYASSLLSRHPQPIARFDWGPLWVNPRP